MYRRTSRGTMQNRPDTIYVVDDEEVITWTLAKILNAAGFDAKGFCDPLEALEAARSIAPTILLTDVMMPGLNGIDLAIRVRELCPECRIILASGNYATLSDTLLDTAIQSGFAMLHKPLHPSAIISAVRGA